MQNRVYDQCRKLFREAKSLPPDEWPEFIRDHCGLDPELEATLTRLLNAARNPDPLSPLIDSEVVHRRIGGWEVIDEIGKGGAGVVFRARRVGSPEGGIVALKVLRSDRLTSDAVSRLANERRLLAGLRHDNIVRILDSGETPSRLPFFTMELVDGVSIAEYCRRLRLSIRQRVKLFRQVCVAVQFLHDYGILHRDLTPNNLLVLPDGLVKVVDFGISKSFDANTTSEDLAHGVDRMMTPAYASPEQLGQKELTPQSDVYSMGVVLYELLTGSLPDDPLEPVRSGRLAPRGTRRQIKASERVAFRANECGIPETFAQSQKSLRGSLDNILAMALQQDPVRRYHTAELFRIDLARHLDGLDTLADRRVSGRSILKFWRR